MENILDEFKIILNEKIQIFFENPKYLWKELKKFEILQSCIKAS